MSDTLTETHPFPHYDEPITYISVGKKLRGWEYNGWKPESLSWKQSCYIHAGISGPQVLVDGPDADAFFDRICTNGLKNFPGGTMRHAVMCTDDGLIASHGILQRYEDGQYCFFAGGPWPMVQAVRLGMNVNARMEERYIFQIAGPRSLEALQRATGEDLSDIGFLRYRNSCVAGRQVEVGRIGMSGNLAYELRGPLEDGAAVYDAVYQCNREIGMERLGWRTYLVNHVEGGFPQMCWTFASSMSTDPLYRQLVGPDDWTLHWTRSGSYDHSEMRPRQRNPFELNWDKSVKFDHDFIGRAVLEEVAKAPPRRTVTLRWNPEDVIDIHASLFRPGEEYKTMELPTTPTWKDNFLEHADRVTCNGKLVGVSSGNIYSYHYRGSLSMGCIDTEFTAPGTELTVEWGDHGRRIKPVRVTVDRFPYLQAPRNSDEAAAAQ